MKNYEMAHMNLSFHIHVCELVKGVKWSSLKCFHNCQVHDPTIEPYIGFTYTSSNYHCHWNVRLIVD
jgi:hypothetical protein